MTELEIGWLAGILEGEGSFMSSNGTNGARIGLEMTDKDTVERVAKLTNGKMYGPRNRGHKPLYQLVIQGDDAVLVMNVILPLMSARRTEKITALISRAARRMSLSERGRKGARARQGLRRDTKTLPLGF